MGNNLRCTRCLTWLPSPRPSSPPPASPPPRPTLLPPPPPPLLAPPRQPLSPLSQPAHNYETIIKEADPTSGNLKDHMFSGIFLNQKRMKYWVDEESLGNYFMLFARVLSITWGNDPRYWQWFTLQETSDAGVELARLLAVCWLEMHGKFDISYLTPGRTYEVAFVVLIEETATGWDVPINLQLVGANGSVQKRQEMLGNRPKGEWVELIAGEFEVTEAMAGEIEFILFEYESLWWKSGLVVRGVCIRPKK